MFHGFPLIVRNIIGDVFGPNLVRVTFARELYVALKQSMDAGKNEEDPCILHTIEYQKPLENPDAHDDICECGLCPRPTLKSSLKIRRFVDNDVTIIGTYDTKLFKPLFYMDANEAKKYHQPLEEKNFVDYGITLQ